MCIFCQAAEGQQCIFCCQASALGNSALQKAQIWAFSVGYQQYTTHLTPLTQNCGLVISAHRSTQHIEHSKWWTEHFKTTHRKELSLQEHLGTLWTSEERQVCIWLNHAGSAAKTMKWIKSSEAHLEFWFIILILSLWCSFSTQLLHSKRFGLDLLFLYKMPAFSQITLIPLWYLTLCWWSVKHGN